MREGLEQLPLGHVGTRRHREIDPASSILCNPKIEDIKRIIKRVIQRNMNNIALSLKEKRINKELYGQLPRISHVIRTRRLRSIGHVWRRQDKCFHQLLYWESNHGQRSNGRPPTSFTEQICKDTNLTQEQILRSMQDRVEWRSIFKGIPSSLHQRAGSRYE